jgi:uncharacterized protein
MTAATTEATTPIAEEFIDGLADMMTYSARTPILRRPDEYGLV